MRVPLEKDACTLEKALTRLLTVGVSRWWDRPDGEAAVAGCGGTRITHLDGAVAACTEELLGRPCHGGAHVSVAPCEAVLGRGGCEHCEVVFEAEQLVRAACGQAAPRTAGVPGSPASR